MHFRFLIAPLSATILLWSASASAIPVTASPCNNGAGCGPNELCEIVGGSSGGCNPSVVCDPVVTNIYGCVPQPVACVTTSECPFPLTCVSDGDATTGTGSGGSTGSISTDPAAPPVMTDLIAPPIMDPIEPLPTGKTCTYEPQTCTTSTDCGDARFDCIEIGRTEVCGGVVQPDAGGGTGGATGTGTTAPGSGRAAAPPSGDIAIAPQDPPVCEVQEIIRACFPKTVACKTTADCKDGWSCYDFAAQTEAPFYNATGPNLYCMPPGLVLVLDGQVGVSGGDAFAEGGIVGGIPPRSKGTGTTGGIDESGGGPKAELSSGGCSTAGTHSNADGLWTLLALAGAMIFNRRSRR